MKATSDHTTGDDTTGDDTTGDDTTGDDTTGDDRTGDDTTVPHSRGMARGPGGAGPREADELGADELGAGAARAGAARGWTSEVAAHLAWLLAGHGRGLDGGAELEVAGLDGTPVFLAPLARHHRLDDDGENVWVRPVVGGYHRSGREPGDWSYTFDEDAARRRGLNVTLVERVGEELRFPQPGTGQHAVVRRARGELLAELRRWDTYVLTRVDARHEAELADLRHDP